VTHPGQRISEGKKSVFGGRQEMMGMETIRKIRLALSKGMSIRGAAKKFSKSRNTIRKIMHSEKTSFSYQRKEQRYPALDGYIEALELLLESEAALAPSKRRTVLSLYAELQGQVSSPQILYQIK
jgi:transposase